MTKEEFIAKHGEEAYKEHIEKAKERYKKNRIKILENRNLKYHTDKKYNEAQKEHARRYTNSRWENDEKFRKSRTTHQEKYLENLREKLGPAHQFALTQYVEYSRKKINNWKEYIYDILKADAVCDGDERFLSEDFLYERFLDNKEYDLYYGNIQIVKYFIPLMCIKIYDNEIFNDNEIEMLNYFKTFTNTTKKKPIKYSDKIIFMPKEYLHNNEKATEIMKLYNIIADFMLNKKIYE